MTQLEIKREAVRRPFGRRRKSCPFSGSNAQVIDYKDTKLLARYTSCLLYTSPSPRDNRVSRMPSSA